MHTDMQIELPERRRHSADVILSEHEIFVEGGAVPKTKSNLRLGSCRTWMRPS